MKQKYHQPFKGMKPKQTRGRGKPKGKPAMSRQNPTKEQDSEETYTHGNSNNYYHNDNYTSSNQYRGCRPLIRI